MINITKKLVLFTIAGIGIYSIILLFSDVSLLYDKLRSFNVEYIPVVMALIFSSWSVLYFRWILLLKNSQIVMPAKKNFLIYFAGFALAITPAKSGELVKSIILKEKFDIPHSKSVPVIIMERFYDVIGTLVISLLGLWFFGLKSLPIVVIATAIIGLFFCTVYSTRVFNAFLRLFNKLNFFQKIVNPLLSFQETVKKSSKSKIAITSTSLTIVYRLIEAFAIYFILLGFNIDAIHYLSLAATYSFSIVVGNISFIPGGLGVTEGSLTGLLSLQGVDLSTAIGLALVIRLFTLWYAVVVGFICLRLTNGFASNNLQTKS
jgi:glycosyltransferase 2 family protein